MENKLLYELEYQVNELREQQLSAIKYEDITIKDLLDLGFDNTFIKIDNHWYNLGYKNANNGEYVSNDFDILNEKQLGCMVHHLNDEISDYNYLQVSVELVNENDNKYFIERDEY